MKTILILAVLFAGGLRGQIPTTSTADGLTTSNFGFGIGSPRFINIDSSVLNVLNIGDGVAGHTNGIVNLGVLNTSSNISIGGSLYIGSTPVTSGTNWTGNVLQSGSVTTANVLTTNFSVYSGGSPSITMTSSSFNVLNIGDSTLGHSNAIVNVGVLQTSSNISAGASFYVGSTPVTSGTNWVSGVNTSSTVNAGTLQVGGSTVTSGTTWIGGGGVSTAGNIQFTGQFRPPIVTGSFPTASSYTKWIEVRNSSGTLLGIIPVF